MAFEPPERIYLQVTGEDGEPLDPNAGEGLTWCEDRQHEKDVAYVRQDFLERAIAAAQRAGEAATSALDLVERVRSESAR